jgi:deoxycytidylate deaminase
MEKPSQRIDWHRYALWLAWTASQRSEARAVNDGMDEPRKVGAAVLEWETNRILALGYNGFSSGFIPPSDFYSDRLKRVSHIIHAETNALAYVRRGAAGLIAVTLAPCAGCARAIVASAIPKVIYGEVHQDPTGIDILHFYGVEVLYLPLLPLLEDWVTPAVREYLTLAAREQSVEARN